MTAAIMSTARTAWHTARTLMRHPVTRWIIWANLAAATTFNLTREAFRGDRGWHLFAEIFLFVVTLPLLAYLPAWTLAGWYLRRKGIEKGQS